MNKFIVCFIMVLCANLCLGQRWGTDLTVKPIVVSFMSTYKFVSKPETDETDIHKKYLKEEWTTALVKFRSGRPDMEVPVLFNPITNQLNFLYGDLIMEFIDSVSEFTMRVPFKEDTVLIRYKRFFPSIGANTSASFYKVLVHANFSLLKYPVRSDKKRKAKNPDYVYYAYLPGNKMVQVKPGLENILAALPEYKEQIKSIAKKHKLKPNDEDRLINLFVHLNNEIKLKEEKPKKAF